MTVSAAEKPPTKPAENRRAAASRDLASCSGITREPEGPEPQNPRVWLSWVATHRWQRLVRFVVRSPYMEDASTAPDIIHDAMLKILSGAVKIPGDHKRAWGCLLATIRNVARNDSRSNKVRRSVPLEGVGISAEQTRDERERWWTICDRLELQAAVGAALDHLSPARREVVRLRYFEEWRIAEIAESRGCSPRTVRNLVSRAVAYLRTELKGRFDRK